MRTIAPVLATTVFALTFMTSVLAADQQDAEVAAINFLQAVDSPTAAETIYDSRLSVVFKGAMPKLNFAQNIGLLRLQLGGAAISRQLMGSQLMNQLPGLPKPGTYYYIRHVSMYPAAKVAQDVTVEKEAGGWKVIGFMFTPCAVKAMFKIAVRCIGGLCLLAAATFALGLDQKSEDSLLDIQTFASQLADTPSAASIEADRELIQSIRTKANAIYDRLRNVDGSLPKEYSESLRADVEIIRHARNEPSEAHRRELLQLAHEDLRLKLLYLQGSAGWTAFSPGDTLVKVSITTKTDGRKVAGYSVQCNPRRYENSPVFQSIFTKLTSPSDGKIAPGTYTCLLERAGVRVKKDISVGLTGSAVEEIEVEVSKP